MLGRGFLALASDFLLLRRYLPDDVGECPIIKQYFLNEFTNKLWRIKTKYQPSVSQEIITAYSNVNQTFLITGFKSTTKITNLKKYLTHYWK
jgi:hypothetical protein